VAESIRGWFLKLTNIFIALVCASVVLACATQPATVDSREVQISQAVPLSQISQGAELPPPGLSSLTMFTGNTGQRVEWKQLLEAMDAADVIVMGEAHTDASGHVIQAAIIKAAGQRWGGLTLSLEEFDRSQQAALDAYERGEISALELKANSAFIMPETRENWMEWSLPKIDAARQAEAHLLASNAPLNYSRIVRNNGCDNLPDLTEEELALFECPAAAEDLEYKKRFVEKLTSSINSFKSAGLKPLKDEQTDKMFRAFRVWDATMAASIVQARADGAKKVLHVVGNQHSDFNGGFIQELRYRDADSRLLVICLEPKRSSRLLEVDQGRADIVIYTRN
jgi:uncharacterized iron-regulated protein